MAKKVYKETTTKTVKRVSSETSKTKKIVATIIASVLALGLIAGICVLAIQEAKKDAPSSNSLPIGDNLGGEPDNNPDDDEHWTNNY